MSKSKATTANKLLQPAHKWQNWLALFLIGGVLLTALSLVAHRDGQTLYCTPVQTHALAELSFKHRQERGLPFTYYRDDLPNNCWPADAATQTVTAQTGIAWRAALDVIVWGVVAVLVVRAYHFGHRSAAAKPKSSKERKRA